MREYGVSELLHGIYNISRNYFNPPEKRMLEARIENIKHSEEEQNPAELRELERTAERLYKTYVMGALKGFGMVVVGVGAFTINYGYPEFAHKINLEETLQRVTFVIIGSGIGSAGFIHFGSRMKLADDAKNYLSFIKDNLRGLGYTT